MSLLVDKHRPKSLDQLDYHDDLTKRIRSLAKSADFPHCLFYGPSGSGKKTRIAATLRELFGPGASKLRVEQKIFLTPSKRKLDLQIIESNYHLELTPSDLSQWDRSVIQDILKEVGQSSQLDSNATRKFKVVIIHSADELTHDAQAALRRTMERHTSTMRLILCANSTARIIAPIRSRCLLLRVGAPEPDQIAKVLNSVAKKEKFVNGLPEETAMAIALHAKGNLRRALLSLEAIRAQDETLSKTRSSPGSIPLTDWETQIDRIANLIAQEQSPEKLQEVRGLVYELLVHLIPPSILMVNLTKGLLARADDALRPDIVHHAAYYEHRLRQGNKPIFHIEAFVAKVMSVYKNYSIGLHEFL
ncbi:hypothetical protein CROQUDRAFT_650931 [Cronartium quercuum f. sp. fusiforme G11]|uniref:Replication factor C subunit 5 n=1 Tax=Cronartium quercuum f. sp. fusiforme G11 TaxID=708437 RepID=A0A9P6TH88_9BASI|nr:hypothetical protein CROQUDRAFT_650931 [Cronartium quercuum f. sp. fusiforme G11]